MTSPDVIHRIIASAREHEAEGAVIATDPGGTILYWSARAADVFGWTADEVLGRNIVDVAPARSSSDEAAQILERLRIGEPWSGDFILRHRSGTPMVRHVTNIPVVEDHEVVGIIGVTCAERRWTPAAVKRVD